MDLYKCICYYSIMYLTINLEYTKLGIVLNRKLSRTDRSPNEVILLEGLFSAYIYKPLAHPLN